LACGDFDGAERLAGQFRPLVDEWLATPACTAITLIECATTS